MICVASFEVSISSSVARLSTAVAWCGVVAILLSNAGLVFATLTLKQSTPQVVRESLAEEEDAGIVWWWPLLFGAFLLAAGWNALSQAALTCAVIKWMLSTVFIRAARSLAALSGDNQDGATP